MTKPRLLTKFKNYTRTNQSFEEVFGGCYECDLIDAPKTVLDIGANEGAFTAWALEKWPECKIEAFEPVPPNAVIFSENHGDNSRVGFNQKAVSNSTTLKIHMSATNSGACSAYDIGEQLPETITVCCADPHEIKSAEFVKIDTEGCELEILKGLDLSATKAVVLEYHRDSDCVPICELLEANGLKMFYFQKFCPNRGAMKFAIPGTRTVISQWRHDEVKQYDLPFAFTPATILDIGANIGCYSMRCHEKWPAAMIHAFEPMEDSAAQFKRNCPEAIIEVAAVRSFTGAEDIFIGDKDVTCSFHELGGRQTQIKKTVPCLAANTIPSCELVKIDTEGCEVEILENLDLSRTQALVCEYHRRADLDAIRKLAIAAGLVEVQHIPDHRDFNFGLLKFAHKSLLSKLEAPLRIPDETHLSGNTPDGKTISITADNLRNEHYDPRLKGVKLFIGLPIYGHPTMAFVRCLMELQARKPCHIEPHVGSGDGVGRTRNVLTAQFLKSDCTHLLFMDSDLIFTVDHIKELLLCNQAVVGGFYPKKQEGRLEWVVNPLIPSPPMREDALQPLKYIGTGFLCIRREVFEKMIIAYPEIRFREDYGNRGISHDFWSMGVFREKDGNAKMDALKLLRYLPDSKLIDPTLKMELESRLKTMMEILPDDEGRYLSEDYYCCQRFLDMAGEIFGHTKVALRHQGSVIFPLKTQEAEVANPTPV